MMMMMMVLGNIYFSMSTPRRDIGGAQVQLHSCELQHSEEKSD